MTTSPRDAARILAHLRAEAAGCRACDLWERGTQTVFGEGPPDATLVLVGEQPGDREDIEGHPFVGPAGRVLDDALAAAGIDRRHAYVTNAVKHFKWVARGPRRIHQPPNAQEIEACRPWLEGELRALQPKVLVCLGATAARSMLGPAFRVSRQRGVVVHTSPLARAVMATYHPSAVLRSRTSDERHEQFDAIVADLRVITPLVEG